MRKLYGLIIIVVMMLTLVAGCTTPATEEPEVVVETSEEEPAEEPAAEEPAAEEPAAEEPAAEEPAAEEPAAEEPAAEEPAAEEPAAEEPVVVEPKVLTWVMHKEPISLDASKTNDSMSSDVLYLLSEGLLRSFDGEIIPGVAETWEASEDGLTYTFHLRESVWEDGEPVTAQQFEYSIKRFLAPETAAAFADSVYQIANAEAYNTGELADASEVGVKATDDKTLVFTLNYPTPYFLMMIATSSNFFPLRQEYVEQFGDTFAADENSFLSNGPFTLVKWEHESSISLAKNPNYWNADAIKLDEIVEYIIPDANTIVSMFDAGEIDYIPELSVDYTANYPDAQISLGGSLQFLQFNLNGMTPESGALVSNKNFRKALSYAIDREAIINAVSGVGTLPADRFTNPDIFGVEDTFDNEYPITEGVVPPNADPDQAKAFFDAALEELGMTVDELPTLTYVCMESTLHKLYAEAFVDAWSQVLGLNTVEIQILPVPQALQAMFGYQYDIFLLGMGTETDPYIMLSYWVTDGSVNFTGWADDTYTEMVDSTNTILDPRTRFDVLFEAETYLIENGPNEPLWFPGSAYVYQDYVTGIVRSSVGVQNQLIYADINK